MKRALLFLVSTASVLLAGGGPIQASAEGTPDIFWKTNAHGMPISSVALSPSGLVASATISQGFDGSVRVWRTRDVSLMKDFLLNQEDVFSLAFSPDGSYLAEGGGGGVEDYEGRSRIWSTADWAIVARGGAGPNDFVAS